MFEHKGFKIDVTNAGTFYAKVGEVEFTKPTLAEVKAAIDTETNINVKDQKINLEIVGILCLDNYINKNDAKVKRGIVTGVNRTTRDLQIADTPKGYVWRSVIPYSEENERFLVEKLEVDRAANRTQRIVGELELKPGGYGRIDAAGYAAKLAEIESDYAAKAAKSKEIHAKLAAS